MEITSKNKERYIKRVLIIALKNYCYNWLNETSYRNSFAIENVTKLCSKYRMRQVKQYIYENCFLHKNVWHVYERIKYFIDIRDLLYYLAPKNYYNPESTLLYILRNSKTFAIVNKQTDNRYYLRDNSKDNIPHISKELTRDLKIFIHSYVELLLNIKKEPFTLGELYSFFVNEELEYNLAKNKHVFLYLKEKESKNINEILRLISEDNLKSVDEIFKELIKYDYKRFVHMIDNYYGSKKWNKNVQFKAYLKLFDIYRRDKEKARKLGKLTLQLMEESDLNNKQMKKIRRIIKRNMKGGR